MFLYDLHVACTNQKYISFDNSNESITDNSANSLTQINEYNKIFKGILNQLFNHNLMKADLTKLFMVGPLSQYNLQLCTNMVQSVITWLYKNRVNKLI